jgi:hypothetical protein
LQEFVPGPALVGIGWVTTVVMALAALALLASSAGG